MRYIYFVLLLLASLATTQSMAIPVDYEMKQALHCSRFFDLYETRYRLPKDTLHSIALKESGRKHPVHKAMICWPWAVHSEKKSFYFHSKPEAVKFVKQQLRKGKHNIDVGPMQINWLYHHKNFSSVEQMLDPKHNIEFAAKFLKSKFVRLGSWNKAIAHYHSANPAFGTKYSKDILKIATKLPKNKQIILKHYAPNYALNMRAVS